MEIQIDKQYLLYKATTDRRLKMRADNLAAITTYTQKQQLLSKKNSKLQPIQKFVSKLKGQNRNIEALLVEMDTLNLSKFLEEVASIIASSVSQKQIDHLSEMSSKLTQYYQKFSSLLIKELKKQFETVLAAPDNDKNQLKAILHLTTELFLCGFPLPYKQISEFIKKIFKAVSPNAKQNLTQLQKKQKIYHYNSDIYAMFISNYGEVFCNRTSKNIKKWMKQGYQIKKFPEMLPVKTKEDLSKFFEKYVKQVFILVESLYKNLKEMQNSLTEQLKLNGSFNQETERKYKQSLDRFISIKNKLILISEAIDEPIDMEVLNSPVIEVDEISKSFLCEMDNGEIFEDQYQSELYTKLISVEDNEGKVVEEEKSYEQFKTKLDTCKNMNDADEIVRLFQKVNTRKNRRMLVRDLIEYRKQYQLVTPFLCRIAATLHQKNKDIAEYLNELLFNDYQKLRESTANTFVIIDKRTRNLKYICELTKFKLIEPEKVLNCIKLLIEDLNGSNIDLLIACMESVGRFLYINKTCAARFRFLLTQLQNVLKKKSLPIMTESQIVNCINLIKPNNNVKVKKEKRIRSQLELKIDEILIDINEETLESAIQKFNKVQLTQEVVSMVHRKVIKKIPKYRFISNYLFAVLISKINNVNLSKLIVVSSKTKLFEAISHELSQESIEWARFYGELFNYELIEREDLFAMFQNLLKIQDNYLTVINCFCALLEVCRQYLMGFKKSSSINKKLRLMFAFKKYVNTRKYIPMFVEFSVLDILDKLQPEILNMNVAHIDNFLNHADNAQKGKKKEINQLQQLEVYLNGSLKQEKPVRRYRQKETNSNVSTTSSVQKEIIEFKNDEEFDERTREPVELPEYIQPRVNEFDKELEMLIESQLEHSGNRITKRKILDNMVFNKKIKKRTTENSTNATVGIINVIGRVGDKLVKKQLRK